MGLFSAVISSKKELLGGQANNNICTTYAKEGRKTRDRRRQTGGQMNRKEKMSNILTKMG